MPLKLIKIALSGILGLLALQVGALAQGCGKNQPLLGDVDIARFYDETKDLPKQDISDTQDRQRLRKMEILFNRGAFYYGQTYDNPKALYAISATRALLQDETPKFFGAVIKSRLWQVTRALDQMSKDLVDQAFAFSPEYSYTDVFENYVCDRNQFLAQANAASKKEIRSFDRSVQDTQLHQIYCALSTPPMAMAVVADPPGSPPCNKSGTTLLLTSSKGANSLDSGESRAKPVPMSQDQDSKPGTTTSDADQPKHSSPGDVNPTKELNVQIIAAVGFGVSFVLLLLFLAIKFPEPTPFQYNVFRTVLSLAVAGVASMIPGFIKLDLKSGQDLAIRAGGALAVFVFCYFFNPAKLVAGPKLEADDLAPPPPAPEQLPSGGPFPKDKQEAFTRVWQMLVALEAAGERLWDKVNDQTLGDFADEHRHVREVIQDYALFFSPETYDSLRELLRAADFYIGGKATLSNIYFGTVVSDRTYDLAQPGERDKVVNSDIRKQILQNRRWLTRYQTLLREIRDNLYRESHVAASGGQKMS